MTAARWVVARTGPLALAPAIAVLLGACGPARPPAPSPGTGRAAARPLAPLHHDLALVAGSGFEGYRDGSFVEARFRAPAGLAVSPSGARLAVTDREDHRVRLVLLGDGNRVETLAGTGAAGTVDGPFAKASFEHPTLAVFESEDRLVVYDSGSGRLRLLDLASRSVTTSEASVPGAYAMAGLPGRRAVVLTQPGEGAVREVDLGSWAVRTLVSGESRLARPGPVAVHAGGVTVADLSTSRLFRLPGGSAGTELEEAGEAPGLVALASSGEHLYGMRAESRSPLFRVDTGEPVSLASVWGGDVPSEPGGPAPFLSVSRGDVPALATSAATGATLFVTTGGLRQIVAVRDLDQGVRRDSLTEHEEEPNDWAYPRRKGPGVYRILMVGDSRLSHGADGEIAAAGGMFDRNLVTAKRVELFLNTNAALEGRRVRYEVLQESKGSSAPVAVWPVYEVPPLVRGWDVDLVVLMVPPGTSTLNAWLNHPIGPLGIPEASVDPEHLLLPAEEKLRGNPANRLWELCKGLGLAMENGSQLEVDLSLSRLADTPGLRREGLELYGRPLELLRKGVAPRRLLLCHFPLGARPPANTGSEAGFFRELCRSRGIEYLDLTPQLTLLRETYFPLSDMQGNDHFHAGGHALMGYLLAHELVSQGLVPF